MDRKIRFCFAKVVLLEDGTLSLFFSAPCCILDDSQRHMRL